jgi:hypothetical protein
LGAHPGDWATRSDPCKTPCAVAVGRSKPLGQTPRSASLLQGRATADIVARR